MCRKRKLLTHKLWYRKTSIRAKSVDIMFMISPAKVGSNDLTLNLNDFVLLYIVNELTKHFLYATK